MQDCDWSMCLDGESNNLYVLLCGLHRLGVLRHKNKVILGFCLIHCAVLTQSLIDASPRNLEAFRYFV